MPESPAGIWPEARTSGANDAVAVYVGVTKNDTRIRISAAVSGKTMTVRHLLSRTFTTWRTWISSSIVPSCLGGVLVTDHVAEARLLLQSLLDLSGGWFLGSCPTETRRAP